MRASNERWQNAGNWQGNRNRNWQGANYWRGNRDWNYAGNRYRYNNRFGVFAGGYYPSYYGGYPSYWGSDYPYYQTAWDYPDYSSSYYEDYPAQTSYSTPIYYSTAATTTTIVGSRAAQVQRQLAVAGYYRGPIDGIVGPMTRAAIYAYQRDHRLPVTANITWPLLRSLRLS